MASSVVYSSIFGAVMASMPAVKTHLVVFDTAVVDMTEQLDDPVDLLFGVQLGGGTDINRAVGYCQSLIRATPSLCSFPTSTKAAWKRTCSNAPTSLYSPAYRSSPFSP